MRHPSTSPSDRAITFFDTVLRRLVGPRPSSARASPAAGITPIELSPQARWVSGRLMRVNHTGEVCAQALYVGHAWVVADTARRRALRAAAVEEFDHLVWCAARLRELKTHRSYLDPLWSAGAFVSGAAAGILGDRWGMAFLAETERQVIAHLDTHLRDLPPEDLASRAILVQMKIDEAKHAATAWRHGAFEFPAAMKWIMRTQAKIMTTIAAEI